MSFARSIALLILTACMASASGCSSKSSTELQAQTTTVGQQLEDLDRAREKGLLTQKEYDEQRKIILKNAKKD